MIAPVIILIASVIFFSTLWYKKTFNVKLRELLYTIKSPLKGADINFLKELVRYICIAAAVVISVIAIYHHYFVIGISVTFLLIAIWYLNEQLDILGYIKSQFLQTKIYEQYYVNPREVEINESEKGAKNLIWIIVESLENTYAGEASGIKKDDLNNYIPKLTKLAQDNISFSNNELLGGARCPEGAGWTMGAIFAQTAGLPFSFPIEGNSMNQHKSFAPGVCALGDILKEKGYYQEFICGSNAEFGGRRAYFEQHGIDDILDLGEAKKRGYIEKYHANKCGWGLLDYEMYDVAKKEIINVSKTKEKFALTMLTIDTHHVGGYWCEKCPELYGDDKLGNTLACMDNQLDDFINWIKAQDFYKDTCVVITGDHPRMDNLHVENTEYMNRTIYNCFINSVFTAKEEYTRNREFTSFDFYPTVLKAMGYEIDNNRLGLGADLFSNNKTIIECMEYKAFNIELTKKSKFYEKNFY